MKFAFFTLGCKVNLYETQALEQLAQARGHEVVDRDADAVVVNTCTVTSVSDHKNIRAFHKLRRDNPRAVIAACGCFAETDPDRVRATGEIDIVCGTRDRAAVIERCERAVRGDTAEETPRRAGTNAFEALPAGVPAGRTRALLKIEDGCNNFCTYCIIPYARGRVRSMPLEDAEREAARLEQSGVHEIVLTGIEIASYGSDLRPRATLTELLVGLLTAHPKVRFRLGSLDPRVIDDGFCAALRGFDNLAYHFHLSLQSGCDATLKRMGRRYTTEEFFACVKRLRKSFPDCSVTTDVIVGFPGEDDAEFAQTLDFLRRCAFSAIHVFPYSPREGTRAAGMDGQLPNEVKAARADRVRALANELTQDYLARFCGRTLEALPEHRTGGCWAAHGRYGFPIYIDSEQAQKNHPIIVRLTEPYRDGLLAKIR